MRLESDFPEQIDEAYGEVEIFDVVVRNDIKEESNELEDVEAIFEVFFEEFNDLDLMFLDIAQNWIYVVFFNVCLSQLVL